MFDQIVRRAMAPFLFVGVSLTGGCAVYDQAGAARAAISEEQVPGIKAAHHINAVWPEPAWKEFSDVQSRRFYVAAPDYQTATKLYVVEGKDAQTGQWRVIYAAKLVNGQWVPVQLHGLPAVATAAPMH